MSDTYRYLLRDEQPPQFGATLGGIIKPKRKVKRMQKLIVFFDGEEQEPIAVRNVSITTMDDGSIVLRINSLEPAHQSPIQSSAASPPGEWIKSEEAPSADVIEPLSGSVFLLQGEELDTFIAASPLRREANIVTADENVVPVQHITETGIYNIQTIDSVKDAITELITAETKLIESGYKVLNVEIPKFDYQDTDRFKLTQSCVLCKISE